MKVKKENPNKIKGNIFFNTKIDMTQIKFSTLIGMCVKYSEDRSTIRKIILHIHGLDEKKYKYTWTGVTGGLLDFHSSGAKILQSGYCGKHRDSIFYWMQIPKDTKSMYLSQKYFNVLLNCKIE